MGTRHRGPKSTVQIVRVKRGGVEQHVRKLTVYADSAQVLAAITELIVANDWNTPNNTGAKIADLPEVPAGNGKKGK